MDAGKFAKDLGKAAVAAVSVSVAGAALSWLVGLGAAIGLGTYLYRKRDRMKALMAAT